MILVSENICLSRGIQCCMYKNLNITHSHKYLQFFRIRSKIGTIKARDMTFVPKIISTRAKGFNGAARKILKSRNHGKHDIRIFIDASLNFPAPVKLLNIFFYCA